MTLALPSVLFPTNIAQNQKIEIGPKKGGKVSFAALSGDAGWLNDCFFRGAIRGATFAKASLPVQFSDPLSDFVGWAFASRSLQVRADRGLFARHQIGQLLLS